MTRTFLNNPVSASGGYASAHGSRRGSIYAVVMAMAILVSLIGLSAVAVGRINLRTASAGGDASAAELLALSAVEHGIAVVNSDSNWRSNYVDSTETAPIRLGNGTFTWKLKDEIDHDLRLSAQYGGLQPARLVGIGRVGDASRAYSVVLVPSGPNLLSNGTFEGGVLPFEPDAANCLVDVTPTNPHSGVRALWVRNRIDRTAGPRQDITGKVNNSRWYYAEGWMRMSSAVEEPIISIIVRKVGSADQVFIPTKPPLTSPPIPAQQAGLQWTKISLPIYVNWTGSYDNIYWRIETRTSSQELYLDDLKLVEGTSPTPMGPDRLTWKQEPLN